jgi:hypothetical protein
LPYANKADKADQMRRYRARKRAKSLAREAQRNFIPGNCATPSRPMAAPVVRPSVVPFKPAVSIQPTPAPKADSLSSALSAARRVMDGNHTAIVPDTPPRARHRYKRIIDIPAEVLAKHGITRQGNILSAGAGVDIQNVLRVYVL